MNSIDPIEAIFNKEFVVSDEARYIRIQAEFAHVSESLKRHNVFNTFTIFGSARIRPKNECQSNINKVVHELKRQGLSKKQYKEHILYKEAEQKLSMSKYYKQAQNVAYLLTKEVQKHNHPEIIVSTGAGPGIMEAANKGALDAGGRTLGLGIKLPFEQLNNLYITPELNFKLRYFFIRKFFLMAPSVALIAFPGGFGTIDEIFEMLTLMQTSKTRNVPVVLMGVEFWNNVINFKFLEENGFISKKDLDRFIITDNPKECCSYIFSKLRLNTF